jgi:hypothetical protein
MNQSDQIIKDKIAKILAATPNVSYVQSTRLNRGVESLSVYKATVDQSLTFEVVDMYLAECLRLEESIMFQGGFSFEFVTDLIALEKQKDLHVLTTVITMNCIELDYEFRIYINYNVEHINHEF